MILWEVLPVEALRGKRRIASKLRGVLGMVLDWDGMEWAINE